MQDAHMAETEQTLIPIHPQHQQRQRQHQKLRLLCRSQRLDGGIFESHGKTRRQHLHLHLQLRRGQLHHGKRVGTHGGLHLLRNGGDLGFLERIPENRRGVYTGHTHNNHLCSTGCSQARNAPHVLGSSHTDCSVIFVRLKRVCHLVRTCLTLCCCSLTCRTTSTSSSSFTLLSTTTPEHALQSRQHDLIQEYPVHHQPLQEHPVEKHHYQESLWRENQQRGGNPRKTFSTRCVDVVLRRSLGGFGKGPALYVSDVWDRQYNVSGVDNVFVPWLFDVQLIHWRACDAILWLDYIRSVFKILVECTDAEYGILWTMTFVQKDRATGVTWTECEWCPRTLQLREYLMKELWRRRPTLSRWRSWRQVSVQSKAVFSYAMTVMDKILGWHDEEKWVGSKFSACMWIHTKLALSERRVRLQKFRSAWSGGYYLWCYASLGSVQETSKAMNGYLKVLWLNKKTKWWAVNWNTCHVYHVWCTGACCCFLRPRGWQVFW